jgi:hypothetical protein
MKLCRVRGSKRTHEGALAPRAVRNLRAAALRVCSSGTRRRACFMCVRGTDRRRLALSPSHAASATKRSASATGASRVGSAKRGGRCWCGLCLPAGKLHKYKYKYKYKFKTHNVIVFQACSPHAPQRRGSKARAAAARAAAAAGAVISTSAAVLNTPLVQAAVGPAAAPGRAYTGAISLPGRARFDVGSALRNLIPSVAAAA